MDNKIDVAIKQFLKNYSKEKNIQTKWEEPLIAYADAEDEMFYKLKSVVSQSHAMPRDFLPEAKTVAAYFIPFNKDVVKSNVEGKECSRKWAVSYIETNKLILDLNAFIVNKLQKLGYKSSSIPPTYNFNNKKLISDWSQRHVAFIAGLGKFGLNNMLITDKGCCGRIGSFVTELEIQPTKRQNQENCLYKYMNICKKCTDRCVNNALKVNYFDRNKCYEMCLYNDNFYSDIELTDICGKCLVNVPCSIVNPVKKLTK
ncbi:epoxyqueuosine reductase [Clostridium sp. WLY-B-L2]|jgi:epoxyqueuosine reductase QueG|uniref:Epoxyqueuosine reductase n=1 Tax=Clostridium aromativorans TaxID=2836848 RepID=A0ABS8N9G0_9CLOT|nr:epoxyqueuosine reductase [Clostridium aromativorans]MCC9296434.1 epoxyqueuosine reductase [Clostridium aromativorans]CAB1244463.1 Iron-sulfur cluster-binding protein [Clostridiaceae bacterium BL-3]